jgi:hypothetical protein
MNPACILFVLIMLQHIPERCNSIQYGLIKVWTEDNVSCCVGWPHCYPYIHYPQARKLVMFAFTSKLLIVFCGWLRLVLFYENCLLLSQWWMLCWGSSSWGCDHWSFCAHTCRFMLHYVCVKYVDIMLSAHELSTCIYSVYVIDTVDKCLCFPRILLKMQ